MGKLLFNLATDKAAYRDFWWSPLKAFLFILSLVYGLFIRGLILSCRFRSQHFSCKVISVGNITVGGTGKTTLVEFIASYLKQQGKKVAVISRGYGKRPGTMGDEPYMLAQNLQGIPVIVDKDRQRGVERAIKEYNADTVILDDAFQQWKLEKDLEIVNIDATNPFGNCHMLPRGILREPLSSLKRVDVFLLTKVDLAEKIAETKKILGSINPGAPVFDAIHKPVCFYEAEKPQEIINLQDMRGRKAVLFSAIGDPASFEKLVSGLGINVVSVFRFSDHYDYTRQDLERISASAKERGADMLITSEKDFARLRSLQLTAYSLQLFVLRVELLIKDEQGFFDRLHKLYTF